MNKVLGISVAHDSSICIFNNGKIEYFLKEERITGEKRDLDPIRSIMSIESNEEDIFEIAIASPTKKPNFPEKYSKLAKKIINVSETYDYSHTHHLTHANLAFYDSGFNEALVFVIDRNGSVVEQDLCREAESVFIASYPNNFKPIYKNFWLMNSNANIELEKIRKQDPDCEIVGKSMFSVVKVYETATSLIGQDPLENGKVMGLSAYGDKTANYPLFFSKEGIADDRLFAHLNTFQANNAINLELHSMAISEVNPKDYKVYADYAWQVQKQTQEAVCNLIKKYIEKTGIKNVCITGGYGLNVVANHYYTEQLPDINFFFEPIADDSGNSIGVAMQHYRSTTLDPTVNKLDHLFFNGKKYDVSNIKGKDISVKDVARLISNGKSVAVYNGFAEAGPRALGNRSILFDPRDKNAKEKVNKIKKREWYRPFAAMVLESDAPIYFNLGKIKKSEFMTISFPVTSRGIDEVPGVIHVDNTSRIQTVDGSNPIMHDLLNEFKKITNIGVLLNTSFNLAGKPLVETPADALKTLRDSFLDYVWFPEISKIVSKEDLTQMI